MLDLTIILVNYNTKDLTLQCLDSIYRWIPKLLTFEVVVVDNASVDGSVSAIRNTYHDICIIENKKNLGFGAANNIGVQKSKPSRYILFLNTDTIINVDIFTPIISLFKDDDKVSAVSPFIVYPDYTPQVTYGKYPSIYSFIFSFLKLKFLFKNYWDSRLSYYNAIRPNHIKFVDHIVGVSMFVRKSVFNKLGGFDTDFFLYFEETELCFRMKNAGGNICVFPFVDVVHLLNKSMPSSLFKLTQMEKSRMLYFKKTSPCSYKWRVAAIISCLKHIFWGCKNMKLYSSLMNFVDSYKYVMKK